MRCRCAFQRPTSHSIGQLGFRPLLGRFTSWNVGIARFGWFASLEVLIPTLIERVTRRTTGNGHCRYLDGHDKATEHKAALAPFSE